MTTIVNLAEYKEEKEQEVKGEEPTDGYSSILADMEANKKKQERLNQERQRRNAKTTKAYRLPSKKK